MVNVSNLKPGAKLIVIDDTVDHRSPNGTLLTFKRMDGRYILVNETGMCYADCDLKLYCENMEDITNEILIEKEKINQSFVEICDLKEKLEFLIETKMSDFNENEYKIYSLLKNFNKEATIEEKRKTLINLFK